MNKNYETVFIINPVLSEKQVEDTVKKYKKILIQIRSRLFVMSH